MADLLILVIGGTGTVGSLVAQELAALRARVRVLSRDPAKANVGKEIEVVKGDLSAPQSLVAAFRGVTRLFLLTQASPDQAAHEGNALSAAKAAGVEHVVKLSGGGVMLMPHMASAPFVAWQRDAEAHLRTSGIPATLLRPGAFNTNAVKGFGLLARGGLYLPAGDGKDSHVDPRDIAAVAVKALTERGHEGMSYDITGPELLTYGEIVQKIGKATGKPLKYVDVPETAWRLEMGAAGVPLPVVDSFAQYFAGVKAGLMYTTSTVAEVLGCPARTFDEWVSDHAAELRS